MAKCELSIHLDQGRTQYRPGEIVQGKIEVRVDGDVQCNGLTLDLSWKTHGKGNRAKKVVLTQELFQHERWRAGAVERYPFTVEVPAGPFTYHGHYLNVVWELQARADIPWALDPKAEQEILVEADPQRQPDWLTAVGDAKLLPSDLRQALEDHPGSAPQRGGETSQRWVMAILPLLFLPVVVFAGYQGLRFTRGELSTTEGLFWLGMGAAFGLGTALFAFLFLRNRLAQKKLGKVTCEVQPQTVRAGEQIQIHLFCEPQERTQLQGVKVQLRGQEVVVRGSGTNKSTHRHKIHEEETQIAAGRSLQPGMRFQANGTFTLPADAPASFVASSNALRWTLCLQVDIERWPDWVEERTILVHP